MKSYFVVHHILSDIRICLALKTSISATLPGHCLNTICEDCCPSAIKYPWKYEWNWSLTTTKWTKCILIKTASKYVACLDEIREVVFGLVYGDPGHRRLCSSHHYGFCETKEGVYGSKHKLLRHKVGWSQEKGYKNPGDKHVLKNLWHI